MKARFRIRDAPVLEGATRPPASRFRARCHDDERQPSSSMTPLASEDEEAQTLLGNARTDGPLVVEDEAAATAICADQNPETPDTPCGLLRSHTRFKA